MHRGGGRRPRAEDDRQRLDLVRRRNGARQQQAAHPGHVSEQLDLLRGRRSRQRDEVDRRRLDLGVAAHDGRQPDLRALLPDHVDLLRDRHLRACHQDRPTAARPGRGSDAGHDARRRRARLRRAEPVRRPDGDLVLRREHVRRVGPLRRRGGQTIPSTDPPIVTTTDGGTTWTRQTSNSGTGNYLHSISCLAGTPTCYGGRPWRLDRHHDGPLDVDEGGVDTTNMLNSVTCLSTSFCIAAGQNGTIDVYNGASWTATTGNGGTGMLATSPARHEPLLRDRQAGRHDRHDERRRLVDPAGRRRHDAQMNGISCPSTSTCYAVGNGGTILKTSNGGQTWLPQTSGTASALNGVACTSATACVAVGAGGDGRRSRPTAPPGRRARRARRRR